VIILRNGLYDSGNQNTTYYNTGYFTSEVYYLLPVGLKEILAKIRLGPIKSQVGVCVKLLQRI